MSDLTANIIDIINDSLKVVKTGNMSILDKLFFRKHALLCISLSSDFKIEDIPFQLISELDNRFEIFDFEDFEEEIFEDTLHFSNICNLIDNPNIIFLNFSKAIKSDSIEDYLEKRYKFLETNLNNVDSKFLEKATIFFIDTVDEDYSEIYENYKTTVTCNDIYFSKNKELGNYTFKIN